MGAGLGCGPRSESKDGYSYHIGALQIAVNGRPQSSDEPKDFYTFRPQDRNLTILIDLYEAPKNKMPLEITGSWYARDTGGFVEANSKLGEPVVAKVNQVSETIRFNVNVDQDLPEGQYALEVNFNGSHTKEVKFAIKDPNKKDPQ